MSQQAPFSYVNQDNDLYDVVNGNHGDSAISEGYEPKMLNHMSWMSDLKSWSQAERDRLGSLLDAVGVSDKVWDQWNVDAGL